MADPRNWRLYYLICELRPKLPEDKLFKLIDNKMIDAYKGAWLHGIGSGLTNIDQLSKMYMMGADLGGSGTEEEYRGLMCQILSESLCQKDVILQERMKLMGMLSAFYKGEASLIDNEIVPFDADVPELARFKTGFVPIDDVCGGGIAQCIMTLIAKPGNGKTSMALALAANWKHGTVSYYEPEMGKSMMLGKVKNMNVQFIDPKPQFHFGTYDPENILDYVENNPDPDRLIVCDSLHIPCGMGDTPESRGRYERFYKTCLRIKELSRLVLVTTQVKRGDDGENIESAAGSSAIERYSRVLMSVKKGDIRPDGMNDVSLYTMKNTFSSTGNRTKFSFDYEKTRFGRIIEDDLESRMEDVLV